MASSFKTGKNACEVTASNKNNSPYAELTQNRIAALGPRVKAGLKSNRSTKLILKAATSEKLHIYIVFGRRRCR